MAYTVLEWKKLTGRKESHYDICQIFHTLFKGFFNGFIIMKTAQVDKKSYIIYFCVGSVLSITLLEL